MKLKNNLSTLAFAAFSLIAVNTASANAIKIDIAAKSNPVINIGVTTNNNELLDNIKKNFTIYNNIKINLNCVQGVDYCIDVYDDIKGNNKEIVMSMEDKFKNKIFSSTLNTNAENKNINPLLNLIYQKIFNKESVYNNKLAYVERSFNNGKNNYKLVVEDFNNQNRKVLLSSPMPITSIDISGDKNMLVYTSFEKVRPAIILHSLKDNKRKFITNFKGINAMSKFSPDNKKIVLSLSKDKTNELYLYDIETNSLNKLTNDKYDNFDPLFINNEELLFVSNRNGGAKLFKYNIKSKKIDYINTKLNYISSLSYKDKQNVVAIIKDSVGYSLAEINHTNGKVKIIAHDSQAESPTVASDLNIFYSTRSNGKNVIKMIDENGKMLLIKRSENGELKNPIISNGVKIWI